MQLGFGAQCFLAASLMLFCAMPGAATGIDLQALNTAVNTDEERLEHIYLHELSVAVLTAAHRYALIGAQPHTHNLNNLARYQRCRHLLPTLQALEAQLQRDRAAAAIDADVYFEHLFILSSALTHLNHRLYELGAEKETTQKNFMEDVIHHGESQAKVAALKAQITALTTQIDTIFSTDTANMLLTVSVTNPASGKQQPLYQKIMYDYQQLRNDGASGRALITSLRTRNTALLQQVLQSTAARNTKFLQRAWQHTCGARRFGLPQSTAERLLFYFKHPSLVEHVSGLLATAGLSTLATRHAQLQTATANKVAPAHYRTSPRSFFGLLGALVVPSLLAPRKYNKITLPLMAVAGLSTAWRKAHTLHVVREQLHTGVFNGLNSYAHYLTFRDETSISKYAFSHLAATGMAIVVRKIPKSRGEGFMKVDAKLLAWVNTLGSLATMFAVEAIQTKELNFLKDRQFFYNIFTMLILDFALAYVSALNLSDELRIALISSSTMLSAVVGHLVSGKEMSWDRIIYDTAFISTYSLYKSIYFYTGGSRALIKNFNISSKRGQTALMSGMALISNALGNVPYSVTSRRWIEKKPPANMFPVQAQSTAQQSDAFEQALAQLFALYDTSSEELSSKKTPKNTQ